MSDPSVTHSTFVIERSFPATPERVFQAFAVPGRKRRWFGEGGGGAAMERFDSDFRVGGSEHALYRFQEGSPFPGSTYATETIYQDIIPGSRIVMVYTTLFGGRRISVCLVTVEIQASEQGTRLLLTHQGAFFEPSDGPQIREHGWQTILDRLGPQLAAHDTQES